jgi:hypothetical protein
MHEKEPLRALRSRVNIAKKPLDVKATKSQVVSQFENFIGGTGIRACQ